MLWKRIKILWWNYKFWFILVVVMLALVVLSIMGLASLESFFQQQILGTLPLEFLKAIVWSILGAWFFVVLVYRYGSPLPSLKGGRVKGAEVNVGFKDVIGLTEAKREAMEVVALIKDRAKVRKIGGKIVRGLLMVGPPGCGKTYIAKAIAHEAGVPFFSIAGSEFVEVFVGVGASRVRKMFQIARQAAYLHGAAVIFIDELDVIGQSRQFSFMGGQETSSTLNQLLVNMDGLAKDESGNVIVIGATNAAEGVLDPALLRPGRFDRRIQISRPGLKDREELFKYYMRKVKFDPTIDVGRLARRCVWKTPADIENIVKEAALIAIRNERDTLTYKDFSAAIERVDMGLETALESTPLEREQTAYHEAGHAILRYMENPTDDVFKVTIKSRGGALGITYHSPREELHSSTRAMIFANIKATLAGYIAEKVKYGYTTDGVGSDFKMAMQQASSMVWSLGMGSNGFIGDYTVLLGTAKGQSESLISDQMKDRLNLEVQSILHKAAEETEALLIRERPLLDAFAQALLEHSELDYDEIEAIFKAQGRERVSNINL